MATNPTAAGNGASIPQHPAQDWYFEDYVPGMVLEFGHHQVTREEIIAFASRYDPQPFHLDEDAAKASSFGTLVSSGWMTCGIWMRMAVQHFISPAASMGSPGVDEIRWLKPVLPGDTLRSRTTVLWAKRSSSKPDRGVIEHQSDVLNQNDQIVMTLKGMGMFRCRSSLPQGA